MPPFAPNHPFRCVIESDSEPTECDVDASDGSDDTSIQSGIELVDSSQAISASDAAAETPATYHTTTPSSSTPESTDCDAVPTGAEPVENAADHSGHDSQPAAHASHHPFRSVEQLAHLQEAFQPCHDDADTDLSDDGAHLKPGVIHMVYGRDLLNRLAKCDTILSDSSTCTCKVDWWKQWVESSQYEWQSYTEKNWDGREFHDELKALGFNHSYWLLWGKGLADVHEKIQSEVTSTNAAFLGKCSHYRWQ